MKHIKKFFAVLVLAIAAIALVACGGGSKSDYKHDGVFRAFKVSTNYGAPQVNWVEVTIKDGKVAGYSIDARQSKAEVQQVEGEDKAVITWNEKTKKELKDDYGMKGKPYAPKMELKDGKWAEVEGKSCEKEWYEQAALIEAAWLEKGVKAASTLTEGRFDSIAGVTIADDDYVACALEALDNAKAGKFVEFVTTIYNYTAEIDWIEKTVDGNGKVTALLLDSLQSNASVKVEGEEKSVEFAWHTESKQVKKEKYGMKGVGPKYELKDGKWEVVEGKCELEWYEQANLLTDYIVKNGYQKFESIKGQGIAQDGKLVDALAGVTVWTDMYIQLIDKVFGK